MRFENIVTSECESCQVPILELATFCCSKTARLTCRQCGWTKIISSQEVHKIQELPHTSAYGSSIWKTTSLGLVQVTGEEETEFCNLMVKYDCTKISAPQIGFVGSTQVFEETIELKLLE